MSGGRAGRRQRFRVLFQDAAVIASEKRAATYVARLAGPQQSGGMAVRDSNSTPIAFDITPRSGRGPAGRADVHQSRNPTTD